MIKMKKDKIDMLLKDWAKSQQLRIVSKINRMVQFNVRVLHKNEEYYAKINVTQVNISILPFDAEKDELSWHRERLDGCIEEGNKGIRLNLRFGKPSCTLIFSTDIERNRALQLIRTLIGDNSTDSGTPSPLPTEQDIS